MPRLIHTYLTYPTYPTYLTYPAHLACAGDTELRGHVFSRQNDGFRMARRLNYQSASEADMTKLTRYLPALLLAGAAISTTACADTIYASGYPRGGVYTRDLERRAYDNGFREGLEEGQNDARRNRDFSPQRHSEFRDADQGYHRDYGDREFYRRNYRQGFQTGYAEAYNRNARNGRDDRYGRDERVYVPPVVIAPGYPSNRGGYGAYGNVARENGYRDGVEAGRSDARDGDRFDPVRAKRYREGDHDYNDRYGSRDDYKREYRAAFEQGYREGYSRDGRR